MTIEEYNNLDFFNQVGYVPVYQTRTESFQIWNEVSWRTRYIEKDVLVGYVLDDSLPI